MKILEDRELVHRISCEKPWKTVILKTSFGSGEVAELSICTVCVDVCALFVSDSHRRIRRFVPVGAPNLYTRLVFYSPNAVHWQWSKN